MAYKRSTPNPFGLSALVPLDVNARFRQSFQVPNAPPTPTVPVALNNPLIPTLDQQAAEQEAFFKSFSGRSLSAPDAPPHSTRPPWIEMPAGGQPYLDNQPIATPAADGADHVVVSFKVPPGWDGVITKVGNFYTGAGFIIGQGFMTWRVLRNGQAMKGYDSITGALGSYGAGGVSPLDIASSPIRIFSGELIQMVVNHQLLSPLPVPGTFVFGILGGYLYSR